MNSLLKQFDLTGKVALVTGGSSGLGEYFSSVLAEAGAEVVACGRRLDRLKALAQVAERVTPIACDVTVAEQRESLIEEILVRFGRLDVLVNNAGIGSAAPAEDEDINDFSAMLDVNLVAAFAMCQLVGRQMIRQGSGSIINLSSVFGLRASTPLKQASYCASKGGLTNLTRQLGAEWARKGVRVNAIAPGFFESEMTAELAADARSMRWLNRRTPIGRWGRIEELKGVLLLLAGDAGSYIAGQTIAVDGGWTAI